MQPQAAMLSSRAASRASGIGMASNVLNKDDRDDAGCQMPEYAVFDIAALCLAAKRTGQGDIVHTRLALVHSNTATETHRRARPPPIPQ
jgi:hypothetical protein